MGALARIADIRDPEVLEDTAPEEHTGAAGRPPAHAATGEADVGAPEPTGGASEVGASREEAEVEAARETEEQADGGGRGRRGYRRGGVGGGKLARAWHRIISAMARGYNNDAELGAAVRNWLGGHEQELARPRGRASRYAPY